MDSVASEVTVHDEGNLTLEHLMSVELPDVAVKESRCQVEVSCRWNPGSMMPARFSIVYVQQLPDVPLRLLTATQGVMRRGSVVVLQAWVVKVGRVDVGQYPVACSLQRTEQWNI